MFEPLDPLIVDFLEWLHCQPRPYADVMDAWRTSCPRLTVWEDSVDRGFVERSGSGPQSVIGLTQSGVQFLEDKKKRANAA